MSNILSRFPQADLLCDLSAKKGLDVIVQNNLSLTPRKIRQYTEKGIAVSLSSPDIDSGIFEDKSPGDFSLDPLVSRDVDRNVLWERSVLAKTRIMSKRDKFTVSERRSMKDKKEHGNNI